MSIESGGTLAHYRLVERIGEGGMGVVWKALDTNLDREVAIKILPQTFSEDPERLARFEREAKLLASINHSNIATVYGLHEHEGTRFLAMELIPGEDLASRLSAAPLSVAEALSVARQIASALAATHERGVIHRDLKPANVYVTPGGEVKVLDFGIARGIAPASPDDPSVPSGAPERTQPGTILGTVSYMSPEQARGKPLDAATDLWSFGCVLFRMLSGKPAFRGETRWDRLAAVLRENPEWEALPEGTPESIRELLRRCLDKDSTHRLADAGEAARTLEAALALFSVPGEAPSEPSVDRPPRRRKTGWAVAIVILALFGVVLSLPMLFDRKDPKPAAEPSTDDRRSIAILPFQSVGGGDENDAFAAGIHNDILNRVAKIGDIKVISRTSVMEYSGSFKNLKQIGEELEVATVLEGSVRRAGSQVRINVQLVDAATDRNLWAEIYDREMTMEEILSIQIDIAERIAAALEATLSPEEKKRIDAFPTENLEAYDYYLRGVEYGYQAGVEENLIAARLMLEQAVSLDPSFALAYAALSDAARSHYWLGAGSEDARETALSAAERALALDPGLPEAHMALGNYYYVRREYDRAFDELRVAEEQGLPGNARLIRSKAYIMRRRGNWEDALPALKRAQELDPRDPQTTLDVGLTLICQRRYGEAGAHVDRALSLARDSPFGRVLWAVIPVLREGTVEAARTAVSEIEAIEADPWRDYFHWLVLLYTQDYAEAEDFLATRERLKSQWHDYPASLLLGWTYRLQRRDDDAAREFTAARTLLEAEVLAHPDDARLHSSLAVAHAGLGSKREALREGRLAVELLPIEKDAFVGAWLMQDLAWTYAMTGELDAAVDAFDRILSVPSIWSIKSLQLDPRIEGLRDHAGFQQLVRKHLSNDREP